MLGRMIPETRVTQTLSEGQTTRRPRFHGRVELPEPTQCGYAGCAEAAEFRAPLSNRVPGAVGGWQWLCLDHVRAFNNSYNFFDGMSPDAIAAAQSPLAGWERAAHDPAGRLLDPLGVLEGRYGGAVFAVRRARSGAMLSDADLAALQTLGLAADATLTDIRQAYKALARRYHPDSNGGDRAHERKLQQVLEAYTHLKTATAFARTAPPRGNGP